MPVVSVEEKAVDRDGSERRRGNETDVTYNRTLVVVVSSPDDDELSILRHQKVPRLGTQLSLGKSRDNRVFLRSRIPTQIAPLGWEVALAYSTLSGSGGDPIVGADPFQRAPEVVWGSTSRLWYPPNQTDADGLLIANSVGDPLIPTLPREVNDLTLSVSRAELGLNLVGIAETLGKINAQDWAGFGKEKVKFSGFSATEQWHEGKPYQWVSYSFLIRAMGWALFPVDKGLRAFATEQEADAGITQPAAVVDKNGVITTEPQLLRNGIQKLKSFPPQFLRFQMHERADFAAIGFPWINN